MSKPMSQLENLVNSEDIWKPNLLDKYRSRPETQDFEEMCYADFGSTCRIVYGDEKKGKNVMELLNDMGSVKKRTREEKNAIIRYYRYSPEKYPEQYHGNLLKLYLPHRGECQLKTPAFPTYQSFYEGAFVKLPFTDDIFPVKEIVQKNRLKYEKHGKSIELALKDMEERGELIDAWCNLAPESERERLECLDEMQDRPDDDDDVQENDPDLVRPMITLTDIMRQKDDKTFAEMLNRIRVKNITEELSEDDRQLLSQAVTAPESCPIDVLHIFAKNRFVKAHNSKTLALLYDDIITINADDYKKDARTGTMELQATPCKDEFNGLAAKLELAIGARVMLTRNIDLSQGLVNGAFAKLATLVCSQQILHMSAIGT
ncbi:hypothetical protein WMY93_014447 [Mugilogobius chulae]|uniref:DNA helicase Pif1-like 2B domain-containing protein n=1 Tax=Mugilogobius chulae TaxID=88201 RepID=A0AAW0P4H0_9GOBI